MSVLPRMERPAKRSGFTLAVDAVSFSARAGEVHALLGENGAGYHELRPGQGVTLSEFHNVDEGVAAEVQAVFDEVASGELTVEASADEVVSPS